MPIYELDSEKREKALKELDKRLKELDKSNETSDDFMKYGIVQAAEAHIKLTGEKPKEFLGHKLGYGFFSGEINSIDGKPVEHCFFSGRVTRVGSSYANYDFFSGELTTFGGVTVRKK